jgi:hypothetical protein
MTLHAFNADGQEKHIGDELVDFRGDPAILVSLSRPRVPGKSGKVVVRDKWSEHSEYYDKVYDLTVVDI